MERVDILTVYRGRDSATYLLSDWEKYGDEAEPLFIRQYPGTNAPYHKMDGTDIDGFYKHTLLTKDEIKANAGRWDKKALKRLLSAPTAIKESGEK